MSETRSNRTLRLGSRSHEPDWWLLAIVLTLTVIGLVMVFSATSGMSAGDAGAGSSFLRRQLVFTGVGLVVLWTMMHIDYHRWRPIAAPAIILTIALLGGLFLLGTEVNGARRWFDLGPIQFQPSEVAKPAIVIYLAAWLCSKGDRLKHFSHGLIQFAVVMGTLIGLVMMQPDMGTSIVLACIGVGMFFVAGPSMPQFFAAVCAGLMSFMMLALSADYRRERLLAFLNPEANVDGTGWHLMQARFALGDGGLFGVGLGASRQKFTWLPAPHNDAIFAVIGEELGLIGGSFVLLLFGLLGYRGYRVARRAPDRFGMLLAVGVTTWLIFQAAINIGGVTSAMPFTGITLPLVSYGGSSLVVTLAAIGLLLNVSRQTEEYPEWATDTGIAATADSSVALAAARRAHVVPEGRTPQAASHDYNFVSRYRDQETRIGP